MSGPLLLVKLKEITDKFNEELKDFRKSVELRVINEVTENTANDEDALIRFILSGLEMIIKAFQMMLPVFKDCPDEISEESLALADSIRREYDSFNVYIDQVKGQSQKRRELLDAILNVKLGQRDIKVKYNWPTK